MAQLADNLLLQKPREKSGARASSRFEFQTNFSILKILDRHESGEDYRALFDHFDDLTLLDSSSTPSKIRFFQIKGRDVSKLWTIKQLTAEETGAAAPRSIIGKMYRNAADFAEAVEHIAFASNASFRFLLKDGSKSNEDHNSISGDMLHTSELDIIDAVLEPNFPTQRKPPCQGILLFERTNLPLQDQALFVTGRLVDYLENIGVSEGVPVKALYDVLYKNIFAKSSQTEICDSIEALYKTKSLCRTEVSALIERAISHRRFSDIWPPVRDELVSKGKTAIQVFRLQNACIHYLGNRAKGESIANKFSNAVQTIVSNNTTAIQECSTVLEIVELLLAQLAHSDQTRTYEGDAAYGALLVEACEAINV